MSRRRRQVWIVAGILLALTACVVAVRLFAQAPRGMRAEPDDIETARTAGAELLASRGKTFMVVVAHPDDAEWWSGGTLIQLARDNRVILVMGTNGDRAHYGLNPNMGKLRESLQNEAAEVIGYERVIFLRHGDQKLASTGGYPAEVERLVREYRPDAVFTFDTEFESTGYRHPDHAAAGRGARAALEKIGGITAYYTHSTRPNLAVSADPVLGQKAQALEILFRYQDTSPVWWLVRWAMDLRRPQPSAETTSGAGGYERFIVREEVFRLEQP